MSIGKSGRVVLEIDPAFKKKLYSELTAEGVSLKEWFLSAAEKYLSEKLEQAEGASDKFSKQ